MTDWTGRDTERGHLGVRGGIAGTIALTIALTLLAATGSGIRSESQIPPRTVPIHVVSHGWHTGLVIPLDAISRELCPSLLEFGRVSSVQFGWGDENYYRAESISVGAMLSAIAWPTPSVIHVVGLQMSPVLIFEENDIVEFQLSEDAFRALCTSIAKDFAETTAFDENPEYSSRFYRARGSYCFPNTCNVWTLRKLKDAGIETSPLLGIRAEAAMAQLASLGTVIRLRPREGKWPYTLASIVGAAFALWRRRRFARLEPPPEKDHHLRWAWAIVGGCALLMFLATVVSANGHAWGGVVARGALCGFVGALAASALISGDRLRRAYRTGEVINALISASAVAVVLSPM